MLVPCCYGGLLLLSHPPALGQLSDSGCEGVCGGGWWKWKGGEREVDVCLCGGGGGRVRGRDVEVKVCVGGGEREGWR